MTMPEKIWAINNGGFEDSQIWRDEQVWQDGHCTTYHRHDLYEALAAENKMLAGLLEDAQNGLKWYQEQYPEDASEADNEMHQRIDEALAQRMGGK